MMFYTFFLELMASNNTPKSYIKLDVWRDVAGLANANGSFTDVHEPGYYVVGTIHTYDNKSHQILCANPNQEFNWMHYVALFKRAGPGAITCHVNDTISYHTTVNNPWGREIMNRKVLADSGRVSTNVVERDYEYESDMQVRKFTIRLAWTISIAAMCYCTAKILSSAL